MSEQQAEQTSGETGSLNPTPSGSRSADADGAPVAVSAPEISVVDSPPIAPDHEAPKLDELKAEAPKIEVTRPKAEAPRIEVTKAEAPKVEAPKAEAPKAEAPRLKRPRLKRPSRGASLPRWRPSWRWRWWRVRSAARWRPRVSDILSAWRRRPRLRTARSKPPWRGSMPISSRSRPISNTPPRWVSPVQQDQRPPRQAREGAGRVRPRKLAKLTEAVDKLRAAPAAAPVPLLPRPLRPRTSPARLAPPAGGARVGCGRTQGRSRQAADGRRLGPDRCRLWRRADRKSARILRSLCRRLRSRSRPDRRDPPPGRPLGGRDQQGPDRARCRNRQHQGASPRCEASFPLE